MAKKRIVIVMSIFLLGVVAIQLVWAQVREEVNKRSSESQSAVSNLCVEGNVDNYILLLLLYFFSAGLLFLFVLMDEFGEHHET
ncbi:MAG: hypothetical protein HXS46_20290 [Theionarchaea archaeon]|nr:MAG: hypothetical protein AYK18_07265 [Theionarchaea archaeon DG-70]MBU7013027.1 hypothetical protein [Theionarchaea archaeon]